MSEKMLRNGSPVDFQLASPPNPVRVDIRSTGLPFRSIFSDTAPLLFHSPGRFAGNRRASACGYG